MNMTRRGFFTGVAATAAVAGASKAFAAVGGKDPNLSVFLADIHVAGDGIKGIWGRQPTYQNACFKRSVDEILAMNPLPARVVVFGDVALWFGWHQDYEASQPGFQRLRDAGIEVYVTTGNHDHRETMFKYFPKQQEITPVPGRVVSVVDLGAADLFLMDSLKEKFNKDGTGEGANNFVDGEFDKAQQDWLVKAAAEAKRPFFVGAHHPPVEVKIGKKNLTEALGKNPLYAGYIYGHRHRWMREWQRIDYSRNHMLPNLGLPSNGWSGMIGYVTVRTFADRAEFALNLKDFYFPSPLKPGAKRPREWDIIVNENRGSTTTLPY